MIKHFQVSGKVQGVCFRVSTQEKARELKLSGWVRNRSDGSVEAVATGSEESLRAFEKWLWKGPQMAEVNEVKVENFCPNHPDYPEQASALPATFSIKY